MTLTSEWANICPLDENRTFTQSISCNPHPRKYFHISQILSVKIELHSLHSLEMRQKKMLGDFHPEIGRNFAWRSINTKEVFPERKFLSVQNLRTNLSCWSRWEHKENCSNVPLGIFICFMWLKVYVLMFCTCGIPSLLITEKCRPRGQGV